MLGNEQPGACRLVAEQASGQIVGIASAGPVLGDLAFDAELHLIYLLQSEQGKGTGRRLFAEVARHLLAQGKRSMMLWVASANPSRGFYERMGGRAAHTKLVDFNGQPVEETPYVWDDLSKR